MLAFTSLGGVLIGRIDFWKRVRTSPTEHHKPQVLLKYWSFGFSLWFLIIYLPL